VDRYGAFVLHRVPWGPDVEAFFRRARERGRRVLFDTDDFTFDRRAAQYVAALEDMSEEQRNLYIDGLDRYRRTMLECDAVLVSTEPLRDLAADVHSSVEVAPNVASAEMERWPVPSHDRDPQEVTLGYMSGTPTHDRDFEGAADAVLATLAEHPGARLLTVGPLRLDERFEHLGDQVVQLPLRPWPAYAELLGRIDVNLAPLEPNNLFTECKSSIKWLEAGLVGIPTVASPRTDFVRVIEPGRTGLLAETPEEWREALLRLAGDAALRRDMGSRAREQILAGHVTRARAPELYRAVSRLAGTGGGPLSVNWMMIAPLPTNSGGYRNIFRIANLLGEAGHDIRFCVEPIVHLEGMSDAEIVAFHEEAFGPLHGEVVVGSWNAPRADVMIATHWPTAFGVAESNKALFKAYYIQDFEPEFYAAGDPRYAEAEKTYALPLRHICLGRHLADRLTEFSGKPADTIDFALDEPFRLLRDPAERGERVRVLFFARPSLRRRGYGLGVEALAELKRRRPDCEVVFFGSPAEELGEVPFEFTNLGVLEAEDVARAMNDSHILYALSLTNISNVPYEGMACGCAVVDADMPNVSSMVDAGNNCLLAEPQPKAMADALLRLVDDPDLRERLGRRGAQDQSVRTWARTASQFEENLLRLCFTRLAGADNASHGTRPQEPSTAAPDGDEPRLSALVADRVSR
jgi:glycosyltransferase involved in cell wall biosynthesis